MQGLLTLQREDSMKWNYAFLQAGQKNAKCACKRFKRIQN